jgi:hypothetical protein
MLSHKSNHSPDDLQLGEQLFDYGAVDIRQPEVAPLVAVGADKRSLATMWTFLSPVGAVAPSRKGLGLFVSQRDNWIHASRSKSRNGAR